MNENNIAVNDDSQGRLYIYGTRGYSAYEVAVRNGYEGTEQEWLDSLVGPQGEQGIEGKSAYEVAVENGYIGTEEEWVNDFLTPDGYYNKTQVDVKLKVKPYYFNTVADMKSADLKDGDCAITLGYYEANDGGGAEYIIVSNEPDKYYESLDNNLYGELVGEDGKINMAQLGAIADNNTNNRSKFETAFSYFDIVYLVEKEVPYKADYLIVPENKKLIGIGKPQVNLQRTSAQPYSKCNSNSEIHNIIFNSLNENLEWNRFSLEQVNNVIIENCSFIGFRHISSSPNAWGMLISNANNIQIKNCYYENNTQSDIAIVNEVDNLMIEHCNGSVFHINFEPDAGKTVTNVKVNNCYDIDKLEVRDNTLTKYGINNVIISNCNINTFNFKGGEITLENTHINDIVQLLSNNITFGGIINNINSFGYHKNLNDDPLLLHCAMRDASVPERGENYWNTSYSNIPAGINRIVDNDKGEIIQMNGSHANGIVGLYRDFPVTPGKTYSVRALMNTVSGDTINYAGYNANFRLLNSSNEMVTMITVVMDRNNVNEESIWHERIAFVTIPEGITKLRVEMTNSYTTSPSKATANYKYVLVNEIDLSSTTDDSELKSYSDTVPIYSVTFNKMNLANDILYYKDAVSAGYIGMICTASGNPGTWKKFGKIE